MPSERWQQLEQLFAEAVALPVDRREAFVDGASGADSGLRDELTALLATVERAGPFLSSTALDVFARQISREGWSVRPGDTIGSYAIERGSAPAAPGEVWRARDERIGRDVAIKLLLPHPANGERLSTLHDEARAAGTLNHPNVVTVYDVGSHGGAPYLVTECLEGESLRARLGAGALPLDDRPGDRAADRPRARRCPRPRHRARRSQAGERLRRHRRPGEDPRLRPGHAARPIGVAERRREARRRDGHGELHGAGTVAGRGHRRPHRPLRAGRRAPRDAHRPPAVRRRQHRGHDRAHPDRARREPLRRGPRHPARRVGPGRSLPRRRTRPIASAPPTTPSPPSSRRSWRGCLRHGPAWAPSSAGPWSRSSGCRCWPRSRRACGSGASRRIASTGPAPSHRPRRGGSTIMASTARRISWRAARWPWHLTIRRSSSCGSRCPSSSG